MAKTKADPMQEDITRLQNLYETLEIPSKAQDFIWQTVATFCLYQLGNRKGYFYDACKEAGILEPAPAPKVKKPAGTKAAKPRAK